MKNKFLIAVALISSVWACKPKEDEPTPTVSVKTTYDFTNVDYSDSDTLLKRYTDLSNESNKARLGTASKSLMEDIYTNNSKYPESFSLSGKSISSTSKLVLVYIDTMGTYQTTATATNGKAGVVTSGTSTWFVDSKGFEPRQLMAKVLMGSLWYNQIKTLLNNDYNLDNTTVVDGEGTAMEHNWDLAFGLFGVPKDFPSNTTGLKNLGSYSNQVNSMIGCNAKIMAAFIAGRAAISNKDMTTKYVQRAIILSELERVIAAAAVLELGEVKTNFNDQAKVLHYVSEAYGFILALEEIGNSRLSANDFATIYAALGSNMYDLTQENVNSTITLIKTRYNIQ